MLRSYIYKPDYIDNTIDLNSNAAKELDWMSFWEQLFVKSVNSSLDSFAHLNEELKKEQNSEKKTLPMNLEEDALTASEEKSMIQSGYLTRDGEKLYLPEIIRHALGFRYERGARPRVLSLLLKHYPCRSICRYLLMRRGITMNCATGRTGLTPASFMIS